MEKENKITFLMPTYNDAKHIEKAINSIINQTYPNWELLIMNDGSTDQTESIVKRFVSKLPNKMKYFKQPNSGVLNALLNLSPNISGNYVTIIASDDYLYRKDVISKNMRILEDKKIDGLYSDLIIIDKNDNRVGIRKPFFSLKKLIISGGSNPISDNFFIKKKYFLKFVVPNLLIRNIPYYFSIKKGLIKIPRLVYSPEPWYAYRVFEENYAISDIGLFVQISGQMRLLRDFYSENFIISPSLFSLNSYLFYIFSLLYNKIPNFIDKMFHIKKVNKNDSLNQLKNLLKQIKFTILKSYQYERQITINYLDRMIESINDLKNWNSQKKPNKQISLDLKSIENIPVFEGKDARLFYLNYLKLPKNEILMKLFLKKYDLIVCDSEKTQKKLQKLLDFFNYLTPIILK